MTPSRRALAMGVSGGLILVALLSFAPAASAQAACAELTDWGTDPDGDGWAVSGINGPLDLIAFRAGEEGDACERLVLEMEVSDSLLIDVGVQSNGGSNLLLSSRVIVDLIPIEGDPAYQIHFVFREDLITGNAALGADRVEIFEDGTLLFSSVDAPPEVTVTETGTVLTASIDKAVFNPAVLGWTGFHAEGHEVVADLVGGAIDALYVTDEMENLTTNYVFGCGVGCSFLPTIEVSADPFDVFPGHSGSTDVTAEGTSGLSDGTTYEVTFNIIAPDGWTASVDPASVSIDTANPASSTTLTVDVPRDTPFGDYIITIEAIYMGEVIDTHEVTVSVVDDPLGDWDGEGLINQDEDTHGTDRWNPDTDGDGWTDKQEVDCGSDPLDPLDFCRGTPSPTSGASGTPTPTSDGGGDGDLDISYLPYVIAGMVAVLAISLIGLLWRWS